MPDPVRYHVDLSAHAAHLVTVQLVVPGDVAAGARVVLAVWTPGSYLIRDYVRHVQTVSARDAGGAEVALDADGRSAWRLPAALDGPVTVELELYANELTVRTNHVDDRHAFLVPAATLPYVDGATDRPHEVTVAAPAGWQVWSLLPEADGPGSAAFVADDLDHLVDSAFAAGSHEEVTYEVAGVAHRFVWAGHAGRPDLTAVAADAAAIGEAAVELFGGDLPVEGYTFLCYAWDEGSGGLEHRDGAVLLVPAHSLRDPDGYARFQRLLAHEYLHLWNVKRLVPARLTELDYERPVHTDSLWVAEGWTSYYHDLLPARAGRWDRARLLDRLGEQLERVLDQPGSRVQSVRRSSHEAWTKFYVRDENWVNAAVSYYDHGAALAWSLDLLLRHDEPAGDGLDAALRLLWQRFGTSGRGYEERDVERVLAEVAGRDLSWFFDRHVHGTDEPPVVDLLATVGLAFVPDPDAELVPDLGARTTEDDGGVTFSAVLRGRPAWAAGVTGGDRLLAVDRTRVRRGELTAALAGRDPGDTVELAVFRGPRLLMLHVTLGEPRPPRKLRPVDDLSAAQRAAFRRWAGLDLSE